MGLVNSVKNEKQKVHSDRLDLMEYEERLVNAFNGAYDMQYRGKNFGITYYATTNMTDVDGEQQVMTEFVPDVYLYEGQEEVVICPELLSIIKDFDDVSDNSKEADARFRAKIRSFERLQLKEVPKYRAKDPDHNKRMWMNKTLNGINLRPGNLEDDRDNFTPITMCDDNVHGLIVGRTGSGKSVFINALILSLLTEYPPWELDLYLADFKKVELSRYMNNADEANHNTSFTPHINACAATSEIRYVSSLIQYLVDCMNARQEMFSRLGITKIAEFRKKYNVVLPRVLLMVDEFQQLFIEATPREAEEIQTMLNSITKLGRATGFHLIFASQEMSGTLRGNTLANFKIRMALPCTKEISSDILGNGAAADLERGKVIINTDTGNEEGNREYRVPFIETEKKDDDSSDEKAPFYTFLDGIKNEARKYNLKYKTQRQKFYREELQETEYAFRNDLDKIRDQKNKLVAGTGELFDAVVLGKTVLFSPKRNDKVSFYIEKGRNKGIVIATPSTDDAARIRKLLSENLLRSDQPTFHFGIELNNLIHEKYHMEKAIESYPCHTYYKCGGEHPEIALILAYYLRRIASQKMSLAPDRVSQAAQKAKNLKELCCNAEKRNAYQIYTQRKEELENEISSLKEKIDRLDKEKKKRVDNPIISFLEKCSDQIIIIPSDRTKVKLTELTSYNEIVSAFRVNRDLAGAADGNIELLDRKIEALSAVKASGKDDVQQPLNVLRNRIFRRVILYYVDRYYGREPQKSSLSDTLDAIYQSIEPTVIAQQKSYAEKNVLSVERQEASELLQARQRELDGLILNADEIDRAREELLSDLNGFIAESFGEAYAVIYQKRDIPKAPVVDCESLEGTSLEWRLLSEEIPEELLIIGNDILQAYIQGSSVGGRDSGSFCKAVFWINGLDEIEKLPRQFDNVVRDSLNQNILVIAIIASELRDATIKKAFEYAFVTGNLEKMYTMFNLRYTKQPLDSIVVNFGIRSKGMNLPFKIYKSSLEDIQTPNFIDQLLNE